MKRVSILAEQTGQNHETPRDPVREYVPGIVDLQERITVCRSFDDDGLTWKLRYEVRDVDLPDWLDVDDYVRDWRAWERSWVSVPRDWPEVVQRYLVDANAELRAAIVTLLQTKTFRSEFRRSLRDQFLAWCMDDEKIARIELTTDPDGHPCWIATDPDVFDIIDVVWLSDSSESTKIMARSLLVRRLLDAGWTIV